MEISDQIGKYLVIIARKAIIERVENRRVLTIPINVPKQVLVKAGVFVTIRNHNDSQELRGCIGIPLPEQSLIDSLLESAISAATRDPRFIPLESRDLWTTRIEVSILTPPELIGLDNRSRLPGTIRVGRDGLMVRWPSGSGLLLPQIAPENGWDSHEFLCQTAIKAGGPPDIWLQPEANVYRFEAIVFEESEPGGEIMRRTKE